jgi:Na+/H+ antiporter NhaD/arsenite permease-like protein
MPETRYEIMQVADAFRAKRRRAIGTLIGAVAAGLEERAGHSFNDPLEGFLKVGLPIMLVSILVGWIYILIRF